MKSIVTKAFSNKIFVFIMLLPFMVPGFIFSSKYYEIGSFFTNLKLFFIVIIYILFIMQKKFSIGIISIILFYISFVFTSFINSSDIVGAISRLASVSAFSILIALGIEYNFDSLNDVLTFYIFLLWLGELICLFLFPDGIVLSDYYYYPIGFISDDNQLAPFMIFSFAFLVNNLINKEKIFISKLSLILLFSSVFIAWSATCVVGAVILLCYPVFFYNKKAAKILDIKIIMITIIFLFFFIVVFRLQNYAAYIIEDILGKDLTLTGRTRIWDYAMEMIKDSIIFGYGNSFNNGWILSYVSYRWQHSHNLFLEILLLGGIFSMLFFVYMTNVNISKIKYHQNINRRALFYICIFSLGIISLTETYMSRYYFGAIFVLAYNIDKLCKCNPCPQKE
ncbi:MAG: O-antigen ligase family protein [Oscillospiraceae bacterium]